MYHGVWLVNFAFSLCMLPGVHNTAVHALQMQLMAAYIKMGTAGHNAEMLV